MQGFTNLTRIKRYARMSRALAFGGLGIMGVAVLISLRQPYPVELVFGLLFVGMLSSQIGLPLRNRWDREPRFDQVLDDHLKGLDRRYLVFHHYLGASHVVVCPTGVYTLIPRLEEGRIDYREGAWWRAVERRGLLRRGGIRKIRGIERDAADAAERAQRRIRRSAGELQVQPLLVFLHHDAQLQSDDYPILATHIKKLKPTLRKLPKVQTLSPEQIQHLLGELGLQPLID